MKAREGDLIETRAQCIFDVKGLLHPPRKTVAFPRFVPDPTGNRKRKAIAYNKIYSLSERYRFLESRFPQYLVNDPVFGEKLCEIPEEEVRRHYDPSDRLRELQDTDRPDPLETKALALTAFLKSHSGVPWRDVGISGSLLCKLHTTKSDIDPIVYGEESALRVHEMLRSTMQHEEGGLRAYTDEELKALYDFRSRDTRMPFEDFLTTERRKVLQGKFQDHDFYIRCIRDWHEVEERYGDVVYRNVGYAKVEATVVDAAEALLTPCRYSIDNVHVLEGQAPGEVTEIVSFRGRFCEQAEQSEVVVAQGKVETGEKKNGTTFFRLLLGNKPSDFMIRAR